MFTVRNILEQIRREGTKIFVNAIDPQKAFDSVNRVRYCKKFSRT